MKALRTHKWFLKLLFLAIVFCFCFRFSYSQPPLPQRTLIVTVTQSIHFGTFCRMGSSGGTVILGYDGSRSSTGDIGLLSTEPTSHPAIFEIKLCQGRNVVVTFDPTTILSGSNGGSFTLDIGPTEKGGNNVIFSTNSDCNFITPLRVGGTLHIPGTSIPGIYTGIFVINLSQE